MYFKKSCISALVCLGLAAPLARGEFLFNNYLTPSFAGAPNSEYSAWIDFSNPFNGANYPDFAAPFGIWQSASAAGFTVPANSVPSDPFAYWDTANPTITQVGTNTAFIITNGSTGHVYSFAAPTGFVLQDTTPYNLGTAVFQFQTAGTVIDFSSIHLQYTNSQGTVISLAANEMITEYENLGSASFGGYTNRTALQWDLSGLDITSWKIVFNAASPSMSLEQVTLDTWDNYATVVPASGNWTGGTGNWSDPSNWARNSTNGNFLPQENGNVTFSNPTAATVNLDADHAVGMITFDTPANTTIVSPGGGTLTANTGITTTSQATGLYTINANYALGAFNIFEVDSGTVRMNGVISGTYGLFMSSTTGNGTLILANNNTFTGGLSVQGGSVVVDGTNSYSGGTTVSVGNLIVGADAGFTGALGSGAMPVTLGEDSSLFQFIGGNSAGIFIDGDHTIGLNINMANGTFQKTLGAMNTTSGATFSGAINVGTASSVVLNTASALDRVTFSGGITGGVAGASGVPSTVTVTGPGTVVFAGATPFSYANDTVVSNGTLLISAGASVTGNGAMTVSSGANLTVDGSLGGAGSFTLNGTLSGSGNVNRAFTVGSGAMIDAGSGTKVGTLNTAGESWAGGGTWLWKISNLNASPGTGWDSLNITGSLTITASLANKFTLSLESLTAGGAPGSLAGFDPLQNYSWTILTTSLGIVGFSTADFTLDTSGFSDATGAFSLTQSGNSLVLAYAAVPEPGTLALFAAAGAILCFFGRRRTISQSKI